MLQKIIHPVLSTMPNLTKPDASISALERAQMDDDTIAIEAIADRFKQALKPFEYREYSQSSKGRLLEWCALVDLDNESSAARGWAFTMLITTMLKAVWGLELLFTGERKGTTMVQHYRSLVDRVLGNVPYYDINTLHQLHSKLLLALGRMKNEAQPGLSLQGRITLVLQYWDAEKAGVEMKVDVKSESDDVNADGQGRKR